MCLLQAIDRALKIVGFIVSPLNDIAPDMNVLYYQGRYNNICSVVLDHDIEAAYFKEPPKIIVAYKWTTQAQTVSKKFTDIKEFNTWMETTFMPLLEVEKNNVVVRNAPVEISVEPDPIVVKPSS